MTSDPAPRSPQGLALALALAVPLALPACRSGGGSQTSAAYPPIVSSTFGDMRNVSVVGPIWFGALPTAEDLELARRRGIERVIDLSSPAEQVECDLTVECDRLGLELLAGAIQSEDPQDREAVDLVLEWLTPEEGEACPPTLMFDGSGGRCATYLAIHRTVDFGVPLEEALVEARRAGMKPGAPEAFVREQVERILGERDGVAAR